MPGALSFFGSWFVFFIFLSYIIFILQIMAYASILLLDLAELLGEKGLVTKGLSDDL